MTPSADNFFLYQVPYWCGCHALFNASVYTALHVYPCLPKCVFSRQVHVTERSCTVAWWGAAPWSRWKESPTLWRVSLDHPMKTFTTPRTKDHHLMGRTWTSTTVAIYWQTLSTIVSFSASYIWLLETTIASILLPTGLSLPGGIFQVSGWLTLPLAQCFPAYKINVVNLPWDGVAQWQNGEKNVKSSLTLKALLFKAWSIVEIVTTLWLNLGNFCSLLR